jgi:hypothetical protein
MMPTIRFIRTFSALVPPRVLLGMRAIVEAKIKPAPDRPEQDH